MTDRKRHLEFCKQRATEYVQRGDLPNAVASMVSDMNKHEGTELNPMLLQVGMMAVAEGGAAVQRWIDGFN